MESTLKRTWAEIDLDALAHNYGRLRQHIGPKVRFLGVVKADAYGHGAVQVARTLQELGADYLAVSSIDEAMELRANGVTMPVLILGHTPKEQVDRLVVSMAAIPTIMQAAVHRMTIQRCVQQAISSATATTMRH